MKWHQRVAELISCCDSTVPEFQSWDIEVNGELRLEWTEEFVVKNAVQIYKDLLKMEAALDVAARQYESLKDVADLYAERLRRAQE